MSFENVKSYLEKAGLSQRVKELSRSSATVEQAAKALGCEPERIAKTMSFLLGDKPILVITAGDTKIDNKKYKSIFHQKAKMIPAELAESYIGHAPGGICPFAVKPGVSAYMDVSLKRFDVVYPAAGSDHSAVELSLAELEKLSASEGWIDVCKVS